MGQDGRSSLLTLDGSARGCARTRTALCAPLCARADPTFPLSASVWTFSAAPRVRFYGITRGRGDADLYLATRCAHACAPRCVYLNDNPTAVAISGTIEFVDLHGLAFGAHATLRTAADVDLSDVDGFDSECCGSASVLIRQIFSFVITNSNFAAFCRITRCALRCACTRCRYRFVERTYMSMDSG